MNDSSPILKPAWWHAALTRLVVAAFVLLLTTACFLVFFSLRSTFEPRGRGERPLFFAALGIAILMQFLLISFLPVRWQYRGTFRGDSASARKASLAWYAVAALLILPAVMSLHLPAIVKAGPLAALLAALGFANQRRREQLERHYAEHPERRPQEETKRTSRLWLWILCGVMGVASLGLWLPDGPPHTAEHVAAANAGFDLPDGATDVSYYRHDAWIAYEFTTDEQRFRDWIKGDRFAPEPGVEKFVGIAEIDEPFSIHRYLQGVRQEANEEPANHGEDHATVTEGLEYVWEIEDRGVRAAFDRTTNRAYLSITFH